MKEVPLGIDPAMEETYASQSKLLKEFTSIASIDKAWTFKRDSGIASCAFAFLLQCAAEDCAQHYYYYYCCCCCCYLYLFPLFFFSS